MRREIKRFNTPLLAALVFVLALVAATSHGAAGRNRLAVQVVKQVDPAWSAARAPAQAETPAGGQTCSYLARVADFYHVPVAGLPTGRWCSANSLISLWDARQAWIEQRPQEACDLWWKLNAATDIWIAVQEASAAEEWDKLQASLQCLDRWRDADPSAPAINTIYTGFVADQYVKLAEHEQAAGNLSAALVAADRAYVWLPAKTDGNVTLLKARLLLEQQGVDAAAQWMDAASAASDDPSYRYIIWLNWAEYLTGKGEIARAIAGYQRALDAAPREGSYAYERLATSYNAQQNAAEAIATLNRGIAVLDATQQAPLWLLLGQTYEQSGETKAAYCAYQAALHHATDAQASTRTAAGERSQTLAAQLPAPVSCE